MKKNNKSKKYIYKSSTSTQKSNRSQKAGLIPGTLIYTGKIIDNVIEMNLVSFDENSVSTDTAYDLENIFSQLQNDKINWINIDGINNPNIITQVGEHFGIHSLVLEDIMNTSQQPKLEIEDDYVFMTMKILTYEPSSNSITAEHASFLLGKNYLISFQDRKSNIFDFIKTRIIEAKGRVRKRTIDYLLYLLIDAIVDNYYLVIDNLNDRIDELEEKLYADPSKEYFEKILEYKKQTIFLRKSIIPLESSIMSFIDEESEIIDPQHSKYFKDVHDHLKSIIQDIEIMRELLIGHIELYMTAQSNQMNNIMKTLTIIASIFIPLTFVAGVYGMNFKFMPELEWQWSYPLVMAAMAATGIIMFIYMKRKHWF